jgi:hypothetical protein
MSSPSPQKSAVQVRLESQAVATAADQSAKPNDLDSWKDKQIQAEERKQALQDEKVAALASHAQKVSSVKKAQKCKEETQAAERRASLDHSIEAASCRKQQRLAAGAEKAGAEYTKAMQLSAKKKETMSSTKKETQCKLTGKLQNAKARRALFTAQTETLEAQTDRVCKVQERKVSKPFDFDPATSHSEEMSLEPQPKLDASVSAERANAMMSPVVQAKDDGACPDVPAVAADQNASSDSDAPNDATKETGQPKSMYTMVLGAMGAGALLAAAAAQQMSLSTSE